MTLFTNLWGAYAICYAIGYMLFLKPRLKNRRWDIVFYVSLLLFSTLRFFRS